MAKGSTTLWTPILLSAYTRTPKGRAFSGAVGLLASNAIKFLARYVYEAAK